MDFLSKLSIEQEDVVGVDITPGAIRVAQLEGSEDKWTLARLGYKFFEEKQTLEDVKNSPDEYSNKLSQLIKSTKVTTQNAAVSIPVSSAIIKVVSLPLMTDEELDEAVQTDTLWDNAVQLSDNLDDYSIFWQVLKRDTTENSMDLLFVASKLDDIDSYLNIVRNAGLKPVVVDVRCFAIRNALELRKDLQKTDQPIAILEIGEFENYILILHKDSPFISDIYLSDKDKALLTDPNIDKETLQKVCKRFSLQVSQMLSSYQTKYKSQRIESLLITSTISVIDEIVGYINESLPDTEVSVFDTLKKTTVPANLKEKSTAEPNKSVFSSVLGLATRKLDIFGYYEYVTGTNNVNLLPDRDGVKNQEKMKFLSRWGIVAFVVLVVLFGGYSFLSFQSENSELDQQVSEYQQLEMQKQAKQDEISILEDEIHKLSGMLNASDSLTSNQKNMYMVLSRINKSVPQGIQLNGINFGEDAISITGLSISDQNIIQFIENLSNSKEIDKASLSTMSAQKVKSQTYKSFSIRATIGEVTKVDTSGAQ